MNDPTDSLLRKQPPPQNEACDVPHGNIACREMTANEVLDRNINERRNELADLDELYRSLPKELPHRASRALVRLIHRSDNIR